MTNSRPKITTLVRRTSSQIQTLKEHLITINWLMQANKFMQFKMSMMQVWISIDRFHTLVSSIRVPFSASAMSPFNRSGFSQSTEWQMFNPLSNIISFCSYVLGLIIYKLPRALRKSYSKTWVVLSSRARLINNLRYKLKTWRSLK